MRYLLTFKLLFLFGISFGQLPEQVALDFYAKNILNQKKSNGWHKKDIKLRYDKHINPIDSNYQQLANLTVEQFFNCKLNPRGANNQKIKLTYDEWTSRIKQVNKHSFIMPEPTNWQKLEIPRDIKFKKKLKYKELKGGFLRFHAENVWHWFFKEKFNLTIEPYCVFGDQKYVWLRASKNDLEYGDYYFIEITNNEVTDWCQVSWIQ